MDSSLKVRIDQVARTPRLLVVSDFDGTLAGFAEDIYAVPINEDSLQALEQLAALPNTRVALLSGRHLAGLKQVQPLRAPVVLAGSHGAETEGEEAVVTEDQQESLAVLDAQLEKLRERFPEATLERKVFQRAIHVRALGHHDPALAHRVLTEAAEISVPGVSTHAVKQAIEYSVSSATKGSWLTTFIHRTHPTATVFLGDDTTDETAFAVLNPAQDLGIKVGSGDTAARFRVADTEGVATVLQRLAEVRTPYCAEPPATPQAN